MSFSEKHIILSLPHEVDPGVQKLAGGNLTDQEGKGTADLEGKTEETQNLS